MKLACTTEVPARTWNPVTIVAALALAVSASAVLVSLWNLAAAESARWSPDAGAAMLRGVAGFAAGVVLGACALVALGASLPVRAGALTAALLATPGLVGITGGFLSLGYLASSRDDHQALGLFGLIGAALLCGASLVALALHHRRR
jgi:hypothetical protein